MQKLTLKADKREITGRKVKKLRKDGLIPANVYGNGVTSEAIQVAISDFEKVFAESGETGLIYIGDRPVLVSNIQYHPTTGLALHIDFRQVNLKEKIEASVVVEIVGESPAEKQSIGTAVQHINEVQVKALPTDLPEKFEVDVTGLTEVDQAIFVKELKFDKEKVELVTDPESIVVKVEPPQKEEEPLPVAEVPAEGAVLAEGAEATTTEQPAEAPAENK